MFDKQYISDRLKEPSTWRGGVLFIAGAFGLSLSPDLVSSIVTAAMTVSGFIGITQSDAPK